MLSTRSCGVQCYNGAMLPTPLSPINAEPPVEPIREDHPRKKSFGPLFGIIIILAILVFGAFYLWSERLNEKKTMVQTFIPAGTTTLPDITQQK